MLLFSNGEGHRLTKSGKIGIFSRSGIDRLIGFYVVHINNISA